MVKMKHHSLFKYYDDRQWAEAFLDGRLQFSSLACFRDQEDNQVREDENEGKSVFRPPGGLIINNQTTGTTSPWPGWGFESSAKHEEIFVFCMSRSDCAERRQRFEAVACVEILNLPEFCQRIEQALPPGAKFPQQPGRSARIGHRVAYYREGESPGVRWALPDVTSISKRDSYAWQDEFRLVFSLTDAFDFEKGDLRLVHEDHPREASKPAEHHRCIVKAQSLRDICKLLP